MTVKQTNTMKVIRRGWEVTEPFNIELKHLVDDLMRVPQAAKLKDIILNDGITLFFESEDNEDSTNT